MNTPDTAALERLLTKDARRSPLKPDESPLRWSARLEAALVRGDVDKMRALCAHGRKYYSEGARGWNVRWFLRYGQALLARIDGEQERALKLALHALDDPIGEDGLTAIRELVAKITASSRCENAETWESGLRPTCQAYVDGCRGRDPGPPAPSAKPGEVAWAVHTWALAKYRGESIPDLEEQMQPLARAQLRCFYPDVARATELRRLSLDFELPSTVRSDGLVRMEYVNRQRIPILLISTVLTLASWLAVSGILVLFGEILIGADLGRPIMDILFIVIYGAFILSFVAQFFVASRLRNHLVRRAFERAEGAVPTARVASA